MNRGTPSTGPDMFTISHIGRKFFFILIFYLIKFQWFYWTSFLFPWWLHFYRTAYRVRRIKLTFDVYQREGFLVEFIWAIGFGRAVTTVGLWHLQIGHFFILRKRFIQTSHNLCPQERITFVRIPQNGRSHCSFPTIDQSTLISFDFSFILPSKWSKEASNSSK